MPECDDCGADVPQVWRHRAFESETRRAVRWICRSCHPELPAEPADREAVTGPAGGSGETATASSTNAVELRSDGGRSDAEVTVSFASTATGRSRCPICLGETASEGALLSCRECRWTGSPRPHPAD